MPTTSIDARIIFTPDIMGGKPRIFYSSAYDFFNIPGTIPSSKAFL